MHEPDPVQDATLETSRASGLPEIHVSAALGKFLYLQALSCRARRILELGTLGGYSTIWLARALPGDGLLISLESEASHAELARGNIERSRIDATVEVREGSALESLHALESDSVEPFDLVFLDADKESYPDYLPPIIRLARPGTVIIVDNVVRDGEVIDPGK